MTNLSTTELLMVTGGEFNDGTYKGHDQLMSPEYGTQQPMQAGKKATWCKPTGEPGQARHLSKSLPEKLDDMWTKYMQPWEVFNGIFGAQY